VLWEKCGLWSSADEDDAASTTKLWTHSLNVAPTKQLTSQTRLLSPASDVYKPDTPTSLLAVKSESPPPDFSVPAPVLFFIVGSVSNLLIVVHCCAVIVDPDYWSPLICVLWFVSYLSDQFLMDDSVANKNYWWMNNAAGCLFHVLMTLWAASQWAIKLLW